LKTFLSKITYTKYRKTAIIMHPLMIKSMRLRKFLYLSSSVILIVGLSSSIMIYRAAMNATDGDSGYEFIGGFMYPGEGGYTKKYVHDLQLYGGNAAVLADEFMRWFNGLWRGESLAYTVGFITAALSLVLFLIARSTSSGITHGPADRERQERDD
jgi:hypothetical protein